MGIVSEISAQAQARVFPYLRMCAVFSRKQAHPKICTSNYILIPFNHDFELLLQRLTLQRPNMLVHEE